MENDSTGKKLLLAGFGIAGLGAAASVLAIPKYGLWIALIIIVLALLFFGGFFLWQRMGERRRSQQLASNLDAQTAGVPKSVSDPEQRARLDALRQKFQKGIQEFKSRGKDLYMLPWFVIIGESGSGKSEAIRHSGIDFPPGMQDELQGSGGTINMDWWFTNRGIIIDTAGKMIIPDEALSGQQAEWKAPREWLEFLRLLRKSRPNCPINGLLLVLSTESLIKDSADKIARKASRLAQQLDKIQRELDVRFPVYVLLTKCDLLEGFREFSDSITDPLLQHQIFGWSNPDPLDAPFRADLVEEHLATVAEKIRRRRLALLREGVGTRTGETQIFFGAGYQGKSPMASRRLDEVDSMFALPQSLMLLAPRLRRYLETIFVAGVFSARPVFLRGIYLTSSMREGTALDEALALAGNISLDQLPESRSWESRAFFLRDLFHEKVFRENGLVTRASNTVKLLRRRQLALIGVATVLLLTLLIFSWFSFKKLQAGVLKEAKYWQEGTNGWDHGIWTNGSIVSTFAPYKYQGKEPLLDTNVLGYQQELMTIIKDGLPVGFVFKPIAGMVGSVEKRPEAQRLLFDGAVVQPLVQKTWAKMARAEKPAANTVEQYRDGLLSLIRLEADGISHRALVPDTAQSFLAGFLTYLTETPIKPDTNLVNLLLWTYSPEQTAKNGGVWPPARLYNNDDAHIAITNGLVRYHLASEDSQAAIKRQLDELSSLAANLVVYQANEMDWLTNRVLQPGADQSVCSEPFIQQLKPRLDAAVDASARSGQVTNMDLRFDDFQSSLSNSSEASISVPVRAIIGQLTPSQQREPIFVQITDLIRGFTQAAGQLVQDKRAVFAGKTQSLNSDYLAPSSDGSPIYRARWQLYTNACDLAMRSITPTEDDIGSGWTNYQKVNLLANKFKQDLDGYRSALSREVTTACNRIAGRAVERIKSRYVGDYVQLADTKLAKISQPDQWDAIAIGNASNWIARIEYDSKRVMELGDDPSRLEPLPARLREAKQQVIQAIAADLEKSAHRFPVSLGSTSVMSPAELVVFRDQLQESSLQTNAAIWREESAQALARLRDDCKSYSAIVNSLVNDDGTLADWKISFVALQQGDPDYARNINILRVYRYAKVSLGDRNATDFRDMLASDNPPSLTGSVSSPLDIFICDYFDRPASQRKSNSTKFPDWGLVRLASKATPIDRGWRVEIPLKEGTASGSALFTLLPSNPRQPPLPDPREWMKLGSAQP